MTRNMTQKNKALKTQGFTHRGWENRTPTKGFGDPYHTIWPIPYIYKNDVSDTSFIILLDILQKINGILYLQNFIQKSSNKLFGQALDRLVTVSSTRYRASTSALSTL